MNGRIKTLFLPPVLMAGLGLLPAGQALASSGSFEISGHTRDTLGHPIAAITVSGDDYVGDQFPTKTLEDGAYTVLVDSDGNYLITVDCAQLTARGYVCATPESVTINDHAPTLNFVVEFADVPLQITNAFLPAGNPGVPCSVQMGANGGHAPCNWQLALDSTNLPAGLALNSSGLVSGTLATNVVSNIKVQVTDATAVVANKVLSLTINPRPVLSLPAWQTSRFFMRPTGASNHTISQ